MTISFHKNLENSLIQGCFFKHYIRNSITIIIVIFCNYIVDFGNSWVDFISYYCSYYYYYPFIINSLDFINTIIEKGVNYYYLSYCHNNPTIESKNLITIVVVVIIIIATIIVIITFATEVITWWAFYGFNGQYSFFI